MRTRNLVYSPPAQMQSSAKRERSEEANSSSANSGTPAKRRRNTSSGPSQAVQKGLMTSHVQMLVSHLQSIHEDRMRCYGPNYQELMAEIKLAHEQKKFRELPKGPIGLCLWVTDEKWSLAVECCLGEQIFKSFICDNAADKELLEQLLERCSVKGPSSIFADKDKQPRVFVTSFAEQVAADAVLPSAPLTNAASTAAAGPPPFPPETPRVLSVVGFSDPIVRQVVLRHRAIDSIVLLSETDYAEIRTFMRTMLPPNCKEGFELNGDRWFFTGCCIKNSTVRLPRYLSRSANLLPGDVVENVLYGLPTAMRAFETLRSIYASGDMSDFAIRVKERGDQPKGAAGCGGETSSGALVKREETFAVHKAILASASPVFKAMFSVNLKEKQTSEVGIEHSTPEAVQALLAYCYADPSLHFDGVENEGLALETLKLARTDDEYDIAELKMMCENALLKIISRENVLRFVHFADLYSMDRLMKAAVQFLFADGWAIEPQQETWEAFKGEHPALALTVMEAVLSKYRAKK